MSSNCDFSVEIESKKECVSNCQKSEIIFAFSDGSKSNFLIYSHSIDPLRLVYELLLSQKIEVDAVLSQKKYKTISVKDSNSQILISTIKEVAETRCSHLVDDLKNVNIIRQLPFQIALRESGVITALRLFHCIYPSARGGYNIKVSIPYENPSLDHYCYRDSNTWD